MAERKTYIVQYHMPLGLENPRINTPAPNQPEEFELTEGEVVLLKKIVPDIKCVPANKTAEKAEETSEEEKTDSEDSPETDDSEDSDEGDESPEETSETEEEEVAEEEDEEPVASESGTSLVEEFPGKEKLEENELTTVEAVIAFSKENKLTDIKGIGNATADSITDFVMENHADLLD